MSEEETIVSEEGTIVSEEGVIVSEEVVLCVDGRAQPISLDLWNWAPSLDEKPHLSPTHGSREHAQGERHKG